MFPFLFLVASTAALAVDPLFIAARYYSEHHDYKQAYPLWSELYKRTPQDMDVFIPLLELKLMFEGRMAIRDAIVSIVEHKPQTLGKGEWQLLRDEAEHLRGLFQSDEGQSFYLQALPRVARGDMTGALSLFNQALTLEKDHPRILWERAKCEKALKDYERHYQTLKRTQEIDPLFFDPYDDLVEAHLNFKEDQTVISLLSSRWSDGPRTLRQKTALASAYAKGGNFSAARPLFAGLLEQAKRSNVHPIVWYWLGKMKADARDSGAEALAYLERFLANLEQPGWKSPSAWDTYHLHERSEDAKKIVGSLKQLVAP